MSRRYYGGAAAERVVRLARNYRKGTSPEVGLEVEAEANRKRVARRKSATSASY